MDESLISWTDGTWNPWQGCDKVGPECENCYIGRFLRRRGLQAWGKVYRSKTTWDLPAEMQKKAQEFLKKHGRRYRMFTCSLSDFFHREADVWRPEAWRIIRVCPDIDFLILTKRANRIVSCLPPDWGQGYPNVWLGVSIGMMKTAWRADKLRQIPAGIRFISAEPLLESLAGLNLDGIHWLIAGGESGEGHRPMKLAWAEGLRKMCEKTGTTFFFKQVSAKRAGLGAKALGSLYHNWPMPDLVTMSATEYQIT
jgi:protein gp37